MKRVVEIITLASSAEAFIGDQFALFQQSGEYEMHLLCSPAPELEDFAVKQGIKYKAIPISRSLSLWKDIKAMFQIARYLQKNKIDLVVAHYFPKASLLATCANFLSGKRMKIIVAHGVLHDTMKGWKRKLVIWEQKFDVASAEKVICVSDSVAKRRKEDRIEKAEKQVVLGKGSCNGVDAQQKFNPEKVSPSYVQFLKTKLGIEPTDFVIGFNGRLVHDKGVEELYDAFVLLKEKYATERKLKLLIVGGNEKRDSLRAQTLHAIRNDSQVILTGKIPYAEIQAYYLLMDILVLPSYREGFPTVVLEACAMGIPVIVSRATGCIDSIVEHETGLYTDISAEGIRTQIEKFFDPAMKERMGRQAREYVLSHFNQPIVARKMLEVVNALPWKK